MNANPIGWVCLTMAIGCLFVAIIAFAVSVLPESDPPRWSRNLAARSFMAAIALIGISIPTWIEPAAATRFEFWLLYSQRPMTGLALGCFILAVISVLFTHIVTQFILIVTAAMISTIGFGLRQENHDDCAVGC